MSLSEWKEVTLSDFIEFKNGKKRPSSFGKIPVYGGNGILDYTNNFNNNNIIVIGRVGAYCGSVFYETKECWVSDNAISARSKSNSNIVFDYYLLKSLKLNNKHIGTSQPLLTQEILNSLSARLPSIDEQKSIADTLTCLDDKIELNNRINKTLEEMAQAIFKNWFVDFEPFQNGEFVESELGKIPKGWRVGKLSELIIIKYGKDHKKLSDGNIPVYGSGGVMRYVDTAIFSTESVLIPRKGTLNNVIYVDEPFWSVDTMFYTVMRTLNVAKFVYFYMKDKDLASMNAGSAVPSMTTDILYNLVIVIPPDEVTKRFDVLVSPLFTKIKANQIENKTLTLLRDILLPKLMSGEIRVPV